MIPSHLKRYIVEQDYTKYNPKDQATWRYALRQLQFFLKDNAHTSYLDGLKKTGITIESIPSIASISEKLEEFGWRAVPVSGFIPPAAFMEMQSLGILPIASDMRTTEHILYTPAPDIVHEAAGHAPILIHKPFADYLKKYAHIAKKAILSKEDLEQYEVIRKLSDLKEDPNSTHEAIKDLELQLQKINQNMRFLSEGALISRMNWWTAEYGLIGDINDPKIFGAGLLSSLGEAKSCLKKDVTKIPLTIDCVNQGYDITEKQPQLFVAKNFDELSKVLDKLANKLAFTKGGTYALEVSKKSETVNAIEQDSGLQISGVIDFYEVDQYDQPIFIKTVGPTQLAHNDSELEGHGTDYHKDGYSTPVGKVINFDFYDVAKNDSLDSQLKIDNSLELEFESGFIVSGKLIGKTFSKENKLILLSFKDCTVSYNNQTYFEPSWGIFDMSIGKSITSVFAGPADRVAYGVTDDFVTKKVPERVYTDQEKIIHQIYQSIRDIRDGKLDSQHAVSSFENNLNQLKETYTTEWLALLELYELSNQHEYFSKFKAQIVQILKAFKSQELIEPGLVLAQAGNEQTTNQSAPLH